MDAAEEMRAKQDEELAAVKEGKREVERELADERKALGRIGKVAARWI